MKTRPYVLLYGIIGGPHMAPWQRPLNDAELAKKGENPEEYEPNYEGNWAW